jgi:hypothetical protein
MKKGARSQMPPLKCQAFMEACLYARLGLIRVVCNKIHALGGTDESMNYRIDEAYGS